MLDSALVLYVVFVATSLNCHKLSFANPVIVNPVLGLSTASPVYVSYNPPFS